MSSPAGPVLLTGATGFVGRYLRPLLEGAGVSVRCATRDPERARRQDPAGTWVELDVHRPHTLEPALAGCSAAFYLVHGLHEGSGFEEREEAAARDFRSAAEATSLERIVYLGGVAPAGPPSPHLRSRLRTGEILRGGAVSTVELRAGLVVGAGGSSWAIVRDLAARLPAMALPRWLRNRSCPVYVEDVARAMYGALTLDSTSCWLDLPGPEVLTHKDLLERTARAMGHRPFLLDVPVVSPRLSSYWIGLVTRAPLVLARELVQGLTSDLLPRNDGIWARVEDSPTDLATAIARSLEDEAVDRPPSSTARERLRAVGRSRR